MSEAVAAGRAVRTLPLLIIAALLLLTLPSMVSPIDGGELSAVAYHLGIAHPTGYPLWTIVARLAALVPIGTVPWRLGLLSCAAAVAALALLAPFLSRADDERAGRGGGGFVSALPDAALVVVAGSIPALLFAVRGAEVYGLSLLFFALILGTVRAAHLGSIPRERAMLLAAYLLGLGSGVHMTLLLSTPALLYLALRARVPLAVWTFAVALGALGRSVYAFLPIRSACQPRFDWGNPETLRALAAHAFAWQYRVWIFESSDVVRQNLATFVSAAWDSFSLLLLLAPIGIARLARTSRPTLIASALIFVTQLGYALGYGIHDIEIYFLAVHLVTLFWIGVGLHDVGRRLAPRKASATTARAVAIVLALVALAPAALSWRANAQRARYEAQIAETYARSMLDSLPPRAVVLSRFWDLFVSPALYLQSVEGVRPDVTIIDQEHLRRSWHAPLLERVAPDLAVPARAATAEFLEFLEPFERGASFDRDRIQVAYERLARAILEADPTRPALITPDVEADLIEPYGRAPFGLFWRLRRAGEPPGEIFRGEFPDWSGDVLDGSGKWGPLAAQQVGTAALQSAQMALAAGEKELARERLALAERFGQARGTFAARLRDELW